MSQGQLALPGTIPATRRRRARRPAAEALPVARVALLTPVPHLDRPFDYEVPEALSEAAQPGVRVRARLAGRLVDGFVLARVASSDRDLQQLSSVHGPPVLTPEIAALCRAVAERYAGTLADMLRFAVPPRHARVEGRIGAPAPVPPPEGRPVPASPAWARYGGGADLLAGIGSDRPARALWVLAPGDDPAARIGELVGAVRARGRGAIVVAPDAAAVNRLAAALDDGPTVARLAADLGPEARYRAFLRILSGTVRVVVGTRGAVFAPVADLGAIVVWDDADESLAEPHAPGWHAREVAAQRSSDERVSLVLGGPAASLEAARMAQAGWLTPVQVPRDLVRAGMPRVQVAADLVHGDPARAADRVPGVALEVLRAGLSAGPVLVGVARTGYLPGIACRTCRELARCPQCAAPLQVDGPQRAPVCATHGPIPGWRCPFCSGTQVRSTVVGVRRTAEEFGRALPGVTVVASSGESPLRALPRPRCLVVATPGVEPDPGPEGYAALVLLDVTAALSRPGLRVGEEALRRWLAAASLVRPAAQGGRVLVVGEAGVREVQALVRWDPLGYAARELDERRALHLPPAVRTASLSGPALAVADLADTVCAELGERVLRRSGPLPVAPAPASASTGTPSAPGPGTPAPGAESAAWLLAVSIADGPALSAALRQAQAVRSARRSPPVTVRVDPVRSR